MAVGQDVIPYTHSSPVTPHLTASSAIYSIAFSDNLMNDVMYLLIRKHETWYVEAYDGARGVAITSWIHEDRCTKANQLTVAGNSLYIPDRSRAVIVEYDLTGEKQKSACAQLHADASAGMCACYRKAVLVLRSGDTVAALCLISESLL